MTTEHILKKLKETANKALPLGGVALLFGSQARGTATDGSDWDVLIVLDKDKITYQDYAEVAYPFDQLGWEVDAMISPVLYTKKDWEKASFTPFYKNVMREGVLL